MHHHSTMKALASLLSVISVANAHMIMKTPIPYGRGSISNSPLIADGSDFPCKNIFTMTDPVNDVNHMAIGEPQTLSFTGSAVHGGGSCQVSLTTDLVPTKQSKWMVIKSIEGGCPADVSGNLPADPNGNGAATFQYTVPEGIAPGQYTIAWTWLNKIGNREFYMNCGRADITAAKKKRYAPAPPAPKPGMSKRADFPNLFVANLEGVSNGCVTAEGHDYLYPNPGNDVVKANRADPADFVTPSCTGAVETGSPATVSTAAPAANSAASAVTSAAATSATGFAQGTAASSPAASPTSVAPGIFASGAASSSTAAATATATVSPVPAASAAPSPASGSNTTGSNVAGQACTAEGDWSCSADGSSFQRCASGMWSQSIPMAAGTKCTPGESANLQLNVVSLSPNSAKRAIEHIRRSALVHRRGW